MRNKGLKAFCALMFCSLIIRAAYFPAFSSGSEAESDYRSNISVARNPWLSTVTAGAQDGTVNDRVKRIALTFDDGPHGEYTEQILDLLKEYHVHATFFVVGTNVNRFPDIVQREIAEGHEVGNHTNTHPGALNTLDKTNLKKELVDAENAIYEVADYRPHLFRPPGGLRSENILELTGEMDYNLVMWSIDTRDWNKKTTEQYVVDTVRENIRDGSIILCHDFVSRGESVTVGALEILIPELISEGYEFVLVSELIDK